MTLKVFIAISLLVSGSLVHAEPLTVAVASNFRVVAEALVEDFSETTGHDVRLSSGSTGKLYGQIVNGAPFDVFLSADRARPERLEAEGLIVDGSRFTYTQGYLALVSMSAADCWQALVDGQGRIAIANPEVAPFGEAALQLLKQREDFDTLEHRLVRGDNVSQALHFVVTGNAEIGIVSIVQVIALRQEDVGCVQYLSPQQAMVEQQAVILKRTERMGVARAFTDYLQSAEGRARMNAFGHGEL